jgi:hypothetical protein
MRAEKPQQQAGVIRARQVTTQQGGEAGLRAQPLRGCIGGKAQGSTNGISDRGKLPPGRVFDVWRGSARVALTAPLPWPAWSGHEGRGDRCRTGRFTDAWQLADAAHEPPPSRRDSLDRTAGTTGDGDRRER